MTNPASSEPGGRGPGERAAAIESILRHLGAMITSRSARVGAIGERLIGHTASPREAPSLRRAAQSDRLVHLTTIPRTLWFLSGQAAYLRGKGIQVHAISSPGPDLARFAGEEQVTVHAVGMARRIAPLQDLIALWRVWRGLPETRPV